MTMATLLKENIYLGIMLQISCRVRSLVYYHHGGKHGSTRQHGAGEGANRFTYGPAGSRKGELLRLA